MKGIKTSLYNNSTHSEYIQNESVSANTQDISKPLEHTLQSSDNHKVHEIHSETLSEHNAQKENTLYDTTHTKRSQNAQTYSARYNEKQEKVRTHKNKTKKRNNTRQAQSKRAEYYDIYRDINILQHVKRLEHRFNVHTPLKYIESQNIHFSDVFFFFFGSFCVLFLVFYMMFDSFRRGTATIYTRKHSSHKKHNVYKTKCGKYIKHIRAPQEHTAVQTEHKVYKKRIKKRNVRSMKASPY